MQWFKVADGGNPDGTAKDRDGLVAGTTYLAKYWNDNFFNLFNYVNNMGYDLIDDDLEQITKALKGKYKASSTYNTSAIATQTVSDIIEGSDGLFYQVQADAVTGDDPVGSVTGNWKIYRPEYVSRGQESIPVTFQSDADYTLTDDENSYGRIVVSGTVISVQRNLVTDNTQKFFMVQNNEAFDIQVKTPAGTGIVVKTGEFGNLYNDGTNIIEAVSSGAVAASSLSGVRQTVQSSSVDTNGQPNYISIGAGLSVNIAATSIPVVIHAAGGSPSDDRVGTISADTSIAGLTDNATNFLYADIAADGGVTLSANTVLHIEQQGGTPAVTNNLLTFNYGEMKGYLGDGGAAPQSWRVPIGEAVTSGGVVTAVVNYALNGHYDSAFTATVPTGPILISKNSNLGVEPMHTILTLENTTAEFGYSIGDQVKMYGDGGNAGENKGGMSSTRNTVGQSFWVSSPSLVYKDASNVGGITRTSWKYKLTAKRGW